MKQILQDMAKGGSSIVEAPSPKVTKNNILINTTTTLISSPTAQSTIFVKVLFA